MSKPDDNLDFSQNDERSHTIEEPHSTPLPTSLRDWLVSILRRLLSIEKQASSEENKEEDPKEE